MSPRVPASSFPAARVAAWLATPLMAVGILRLFPALPLAPGHLTAWLSPASNSLLALTAAVSAVRAASAGLGRRGLVAALCEAAGLGSIAAAAMAAALVGPAGAPAFPDPVIGVGCAAASVAVLAAVLVPAGARLDGRAPALAWAAALFAWIEIPPATGLLAGSQLPGAVGAMAGMGGIVLLIGLVVSVAAPGGEAAVRQAAVGQAAVGRALSNRDWIAGLAGGALGIAFARPGSLDGVPAVLVLAAASFGAAVRRRSLAAGREIEPVPLLTGAPAPSDQGAGDESEVHRLARELRGTIAELILARQTVELQRAELERTASADGLTGLKSRSVILDCLRREAAEARRYVHPVALVLTAVDGLAEVNRDHGTTAGDELLAEVALRLRLRARAADSLGRLGGDRLLAILPHTDERGATVFAESVRSRLTGTPVATGNGPINVTISMGITVARDIGGLADHELLGRAEEALASARAAGGNRIAFDRTHGLARLDATDLRTG